MNAAIAGDGNDFVSGDYLSATRDFALEKGVNFQQLLKGTGLSMEDFLNPPKHIGDVSFCRVGINLFDALGDPFITSIEFGESFILSTHGNVGLAAQGAETLMEATEICCQFFQTRSSLSEAEVVRQDDRTCLRFHTKDIPGISQKAMQDFRCYLMLGLMVNLDKLTRQLLNNPKATEKFYIHLAYPEPESFPYERMEEDCEVVFDQLYYELNIASIWESWKLHTANPEIAAIARAKCEIELQELQNSAFDQQVRQRLVNNIAKNPTIEQMADQFNMSASTLQRKLKKYSTSYQTLKTEVRIDQARQLLRDTDMSIDVIAEQLGFNDLSNFSKSFKAGTQTTPAMFRQAHRK